MNNKKISFKEIYNQRNFGWIEWNKWIPKWNSRRINLDSRKRTFTLVYDRWFVGWKNEEKFWQPSMSVFLRLKWRGNNTKPVHPSNFMHSRPPSPSPSSSIVLHFSWRIDFRVKITSVFPDQSKHFCSFSHAKHEIDRYACISKNRGREGRGNSVTKEKGNSICKRTSRTVALLCLQKYGNKENLKEEKKKRGISETLSTFGWTLVHALTMKLRVYK